MEENMVPIDPQILVAEYQKEVDVLTKELLMWRAYARQLENKLKGAVAVEPTTEGK